MLICMSASVCSQTYNALPKWVTQLPEPSNETYYYRVTHAEGPSYEKAYAKGFEDMRRRMPDTAKIRALCNWTPEKSLEEIIDDVAESMAK